MNKADRFGASPLLLAVNRGYNLRCIELFLQAGADVNKADRFGASPLLLAVNRGYNLRCIELFLQAGADVNATTVRGVFCTDVRSR